MNGPGDPFEKELQSLRPREPSAEMRQRIASRLDARTVPARRLSPHALVAAAGLAAAAMIGVVIMRQASIVTPPPAVVRTATTVAIDPLDDSLPSLWTYRQAVRRSPAGVDSLLARHASRSWAMAPSNVVALSSVRHGNQLNRLFGEP